MSIDLERRPLVAPFGRELRHELDALEGNWFWFVILAPRCLSWAPSPSARW